MAVTSIVGGRMALVVVTAAGALAGWLSRPAGPEPWPVAPMTTGPELVMVFIASSTCAGIDDPLLKHAVARAREGLRDQAAEAGLAFVAVGVALDRSIEHGTRLLRDFGPFDEISVGRGWINGAALKYLWNDHPGEATTPQIVVLQRRVELGRWVEVADERVRYRKIGALTIREWSEALFGVSSS